MKKRCCELLLLISCLFVFSGCGKKEEAELPKEDEVVSTVPDEGESNEETLEEKVSGEEFSFADLKNIEFWFGAGAGGWRTVLTIEEDGSFFGEYSDSEMGSGDPEKFPNGTVYLCNFSGKLTDPVKVDDYTYSMRVAEIFYENEVDTEEIRDGFRYIYSEPYGLEDAENILIYLPGTPVKEIPEECWNWIKGRFNSLEGMETLSFYALNNEAHQEGFSSYNVVIEDIKDELRRVEHVAENVEKALERGAGLSQADYNVQTGKLYKLWDDFLNQLWGALKDTKDADFMEALLVEQREWIKEKENAIEEAGAGVEGGSMEPMVRNLKATELTKARVYELMELLEK